MTAPPGMGWFSLPILSASMRGASPREGIFGVHQDPGGHVLRVARIPVTSRDAWLAGRRDAQMAASESHRGHSLGGGQLDFGNDRPRPVLEESGQPGDDTTETEFALSWSVGVVCCA